MIIFLISALLWQNKLPYPVFRILILWSRKCEKTEDRAEIVLDCNLCFFFMLIMFSVLDSTLVASNPRKLEAVIASKDASPVPSKGSGHPRPWWGWGLHFFSAYRTVCRQSYNTRVWWMWESWHADQEHLINDLARQMLPDLVPQSNDSLMITCNDVNVITFTQKQISLELCVLLVPEWNLPANTSPKKIALSHNLWLQPWWWVIYSQQSQDVLDWFWKVHHWNTEGLNIRLLQTWYLGQGGILSFGSVDSVLAFASTLHRFCSFLLRVVVWAGWTSALLNQIFSSSAPQNCDQAGQTGLLKDSNTLRWFCPGLPEWNLNT